MQSDLRRQEALSARVSALLERGGDHDLGVIDDLLTACAAERMRLYARSARLARLGEAEFREGPGGEDRARELLLRADRLDEAGAELSIQVRKLRERRERVTGTIG